MSNPLCCNFLCAFKHVKTTWSSKLCKMRGLCINPRNNLGFKVIQTQKIHHYSPCSKTRQSEIMCRPFFLSLIMHTTGNWELKLLELTSYCLWLNYLWPSPYSITEIQMSPGPVSYKLSYTFILQDAHPKAGKSWERITEFNPSMRRVAVIWIIFMITNWRAAIGIQM